MKLRFGTLEHLRTFKPSGGLLLALGFAACGQEAAVKEDVIAQESTPAIISSGTYQIVSRSSGKALGVDGAGVVQSECTGNSSQQWKVTSEAGGAYKIQNLNSSKFLDVDVSVSGGLNDGAKVQQWKLIPVTTPPTPPVSPSVSPPPTSTSRQLATMRTRGATPNGSARFNAQQAASKRVRRCWCAFERRLGFAGAGTPTAPITFRAAPGERVVIDHGLRVPS